MDSAADKREEVKKKGKRKKTEASSNSSVVSTSSKKSTSSNKIPVAKLLHQTILVQNVLYHNHLQQQKQLQEARAAAEAKAKKDGNSGKKETPPEFLSSASLPVLPPLMTITVPAEKIQKMQLFEEIHEQLKHPQKAILISSNSGSNLLNGNNSDTQSLPSISSIDPSLSSDISGHPYHLRVRSNKELIQEITRRAQKHQKPPDYVAPLHALPSHLTSWNGQSNLPYYQPLDADSQSSNSKVNIIGCLHPIELILAKADERVRKQRQIQESREILHQQRIDKINEQIEFKKTRAERLKELLQLQQLQVQWMKIITIAGYVIAINQKMQRKKNADGSWKKVINHYAVIQRLCLRWYRRHLQKKLHLDFQKGFHNARFLIIYHLSKFRKKRAADKIRTFLIEFKNHHKMTVVVHQFLMAVRKCQRIVRRFLECKHGRVAAIMKVWDKLEYQYIKKKLEQKRERMKESQIAAKKTSDSFSLLTALNDKAFLQMKHQAKVWSKIDQKMEDMINTLRNTGVIYAEKEEVVISKLMVPNHFKYKILQQILEKFRRDFFIRQRNLIREKIDLDATFKEHHVRDLLQGRNENMTRILETKFGIRPAKLHFQPFNFFSALDRKLIYNKIKETHQLLETFKIKIDM